MLTTLLLAHLDLKTQRHLLGTLVYRIDVQAEINVQVEKFLKNIKRAGQNRRAGGKIFSKSINVQTKIRPCRGEFWGGNFLPLELWDTLGYFGIL